MSRRLLTTFTLAAAFAAGCASPRQDASVEDSAQAATSDIYSMTACPADGADPACPAGQFAVVCWNQTREVVSVERLQANQVCVPPPPPPPVSWRDGLPNGGVSLRARFDFTPDSYRSCTSGLGCQTDPPPWTVQLTMGGSNPGMLTIGENPSLYAPAVIGPDGTFYATLESSSVGFHRTHSLIGRVESSRRIVMTSYVVREQQTGGSLEIDYTDYSGSTSATLQ